VKREFLPGYLLALGAALAYGVNAIVIREGTQRYGVVLPGLVVALVVGLVTLAPLALRSVSKEPPPPRRAIGFVLLSGLAAAVGIGSHFIALSQLPVSIATPISSIYPLVTLLLVRVFLHQSERITWRMVVGVVCVVVGVILVAMNRAG
jgi:drug/metabolite transporter (DMT)-like permease